MTSTVGSTQASMRRSPERRTRVADLLSRHVLHALSMGEVAEDTDSDTYALARASNGTPGTPPAARAAARPTPPVVETAVDELRHGHVVVIRDTGSEWGESYLAVAAKFANARSLSFMALVGRGPVMLGLTAERCDELRLESASATPSGQHQGLDLTSTIQARDGVTSGASAFDRARTIAVAADPACGPHDLVSPGHVAPVRARAGGVLAHAGHVEAAVDLARMAGLTPAVVLCPIINPDGSIATAADIDLYCDTHDLHAVSIGDLVQHRRTHESHLGRVPETELPTGYGGFRAVGYRSALDDCEHLALIKGDIADREHVPCYVHHRCLAGDVFGALGCNCKRRLEQALAGIEAGGLGLVLYISDPEGLSLTGCEHQPLPSLADPVVREVLTDLGVRSVEWLAPDAAAPASAPAAPAAAPASAPAAPAAAQR